ncbi:hypothetical protein EFK50_10195 [Nocardioides marmoriginsengisoli]|uniref:Uncharacterized protein n=1 Tax=Nocardioides marmoriginsengisoli TaxID=661483 RepID=A0A3N0CGM2_9ACTN|nr:hypothetical protein EFK50_10195 [Nocardioides marmoriginsengisoli]
MAEAPESPAPVAEAPEAPVAEAPAPEAREADAVVEAAAAETAAPAPAAEEPAADAPGADVPAPDAGEADADLNAPVADVAATETVEASNDTLSEVAAEEPLAPPAAAPRAPRAPERAQAPEQAPEEAPEQAAEQADEVEGPIATMAAAAAARDAADEPTIALATPTKSRRRRATDAATVPESHRDQVHARREQAKQTKAEKAALKAEKRSSRQRKQPADALAAKMPRIKPAYAALLTGLISGLVCVLLAKGASVGCEAVRDNDSCGGGIGLLALVAILAIEVLIGANLLKAFKVADPFSTAFLGVGLVAMAAMLFFLDDLNEARMVAIIPVLTAAAFLLSWWVTVRFVEEQPSPE